MKIPPLNDFKSTFFDPVWLEVAASILHRHQIPYASLNRAEYGENMVFFVDARLILKIYTPVKNGFRRERSALKFANGKTTLPIPSIVAEGEIEGYYYLINTQLIGDQITRAEWLAMERGDQVALLTELATGLRKLHTRDAAKFSFDWREFLQIQVLSIADKHFGDGANPEWSESIPAYLKENLPLVPRKTAEAFLHGDVHLGNLRLTQRNGRPTIGGLFDFADCIKGFHEYEFVAIGVLMIQGQGELQREFFRAYGYSDDEMDETLRKRMMTLTLLYEYGSLKKYAERLRPDAVDYSLAELERSIWNFV
ncbi:MAG: aminoglycoside phosphotransferase family protein [Pyrinomonadaceae bacterium]